MLTMARLFPGSLCHFSLPYHHLVVMREVKLDPLVKTNNPSSEFIQTLNEEFPGPWNFTIAAASPPELNIQVQSYMANADGVSAGFTKDSKVYSYPFTAVVRIVFGAQHPPVPAGALERKYPPR